MISQYIQAAMHKAKYEILSDTGEYYGEIPGFDGVYASSDNLEDCREQLEEVLEEWILIRVARHLDLPKVDDLVLSVAEVA